MQDTAAQPEALVTHHAANLSCWDPNGAADPDQGEPCGSGLASAVPSTPSGEADADHTKPLLAPTR